MLMRLINENILSRAYWWGGIFVKKKGRRSALNSLSVNLVSLVNFEKYASKEEKCTSTDKDFKTSHDATVIILM